MKIIILLVIVTLTGCTTMRPKNLENICDIFNERIGWYEDALKAEKKWNSSIPLAMSFIYQESSFHQKAKPPRKKILGVIPWKRPTTSYGYAQAKKSTFDWYKDKTGRKRAKRTSFSDSLDFIGFYTDVAGRAHGYSKDNAMMHYHCYYHGITGCKSPISSSNTWFKKTAIKVEERARRYESQLNGCRDELNRKKGWLPWI